MKAFQPWRDTLPLAAGQLPKPRRLTGEVFPDPEEPLERNDQTSSVRRLLNRLAQIAVAAVHRPRQFTKVAAVEADSND